MKTGRPRLLGRQSSAFYNLYLDPLQTPEMICQALGISVPTYYNYERELNLPQLRVGIDNGQAHLPRLKALASFQASGELYELQILRDLAKHLNARVKMIPCLSRDAGSALKAVRSKKVDFALASVSWTKARAQEFYFSQDYNPAIPPSGVLMKLKRPLFTSRGFSKGKPLLGVTDGSVHQEHATTFLNSEFEIKTFKNVEPTFKALREGGVDYILLHPEWLEIFPDQLPHVEISSKSFTYHSHTGIIFHSDSEHLISSVNDGIAQILEERQKA